MAFERIELDVNANGEMKTFHTKQFDVGRPIILDLVNGDDAYTPAAGVTFELHCRKVDDNIVIISTYEIDGNTLTFASTEQLTACVGKNLATVKMFLDEMEIGTMNFFLDVIIDPDFQGLTSETQIETLYEQVQEITEQVIGDDYYNKTEVDDLLDTKADAAMTYTKTEVDTALNLKADKSNTYTKTETNNLLAGKADASDTYSKAQVDSALALKADAANVYTKTQVDDALALKANAADVYTKTETYSQAQVNALIDNIFPTFTASGSVASFTTALQKSLVSVNTSESAETVAILTDNNKVDYFKGLINGTYGFIDLGTAEWSNVSSVTNYAYIFIDDRKSGSDCDYILTKPNSTTRTQMNSGNLAFVIYFDAGTYNNTSELLADYEGKYLIYEYENEGTPITRAQFTQLATAFGANGDVVPVSDALSLVTYSGNNNVFADNGDITVQYKYMSM